MLILNIHLLVFKLLKESLNSDGHQYHHM